jgi:hypothetical protein
MSHPCAHNATYTWRIALRKHRRIVDERRR